MHLISKESLPTDRGLLELINSAGRNATAIWMQMHIMDEIKRLPWWDAHKLVYKFTELNNVCKKCNFCFWDLVHNVGGFHAVRMLVHAIIVVKGIHRGTQQVGEEPDPGKDQRSDQVPRLL